MGSKIYVQFRCRGLRLRRVLTSVPTARFVLVQLARLFSNHEKAYLQRGFRAYNRCSTLSYRLNGNDPYWWAVCWVPLPGFEWTVLPVISRLLHFSDHFHVLARNLDVIIRSNPRCDRYKGVVRVGGAIRL